MIKENENLGENTQEVDTTKLFNAIRENFINHFKETVDRLDFFSDTFKLTTCIEIPGGDGTEEEIAIKNYDFLTTLMSNGFSVETKNGLLYLTLYVRYWGYQRGREGESLTIEKECDNYYGKKYEEFHNKYEIAEKSSLKNNKKNWFKRIFGLK